MPKEYEVSISEEEQKAIGEAAKSFIEANDEENSEEPGSQPEGYRDSAGAFHHPE